MIVHPFTVAGLRFHHHRGLERDLRLLVAGEIRNAFVASQFEGTCKGLDINPRGDIANLCFGVFKDDPLSEETFVGVWSLYRLLRQPDSRYSARLMPGFPRLSDAEVSKLTVDIIEGLLRGSFDTDEDPLMFSEIRCAISLTVRDCRDVRTIAMYEEMLARSTMISEVSPDSDRPENLEVVIRLA